ncbi:MAG TPA: glycosyltransferase family 1 protein [Chitinophaga sp.]|uniref:glycosyltransferase family 4 protein n=1 Tax=Chitinophaga sp. TaxID=1869181 RepID=UPI002BCBA872|nr:glycosyltransferase family 1 protein [Chitinophaga sp.]HVI44785.1 glycosyltransferase family 1 protein [Chitinophaga sp.]
MQVYLDNIIFNMQHTGGVSVYWYQLLLGLSRTGIPLHLLKAGQRSFNIYEQRLSYSNMECIQEESNIPPKYLRYFPLQYELPEEALFHGSYLRVSPQENIANIMTVHDFSHERRLATAFPRSLFNIKQKRYGIRRADGIICISESTRRDLLHFYPDTDPGKITVIHHGISDDFFQLRQSPNDVHALPLDLTKKYILYVGARRLYKNFSLVLEVMERLPKEYRLVVTGGETWNRRELREIANRLGGRYHIFSALDPEDLNRLYNYAHCLLYPSAYEGFGFPPGEAMKAGCPVVAFHTSSLPEVTGGAGLLVNTLSATAFADKIRLLENRVFREKLIQEGLQHVKQFSWPQCVEETAQFYRCCWEKKFAGSKTTSFIN